MITLSEIDMIRAATNGGMYENIIPSTMLGDSIIFGICIEMAAASLNMSMDII